ncbi:MAG: PorT family protein [Sphingobacteriales bacterium]|nr:MAG: PorT family protein [Sphingobacteriales bacterium]
MKKQLLATLAIAALSIGNASAQKGFSVSVKALPQFSFLQNADDNDNNAIDRKATFNAAFGVGGAYHFTAKSGIGLDVLYSLQGQKYEAGNATVNQKVSYVKIPLYYTYTASPSKAVSFTGKIGPQLSLLADSKVTDGDGHDLVSDSKANYESATFGAVLGAGARFRLNSRFALSTEARFDYDFTNAEDDSRAGYPAGRAKTYNMTTGIEVGLHYKLR